MNGRLHQVSILTLSALAAAWLSAQQPGRDSSATAAAATPVGSASVSGIVISTDAQPRPLRRAIVTLSGPRLPTGRSAVTDDDGRFAISRIPAGTFTLSASKPAYLAAAFGSKTIGRAGTPISLSAGQELANATIAMTHGAAIAGTIRDQRNEVAPGVEVVAYRVRPDAAGGAVVGTSMTAATDDRGRYRIFGLMPGEYIVAANPSAPGLGEIGLMADSDVDAALHTLQQRAGRATQSPAGSTATAAASERQRGYSYAPVFFPGVPSPANATRLTLTPGESHLGADFSILLNRAASISGVILAAPGRDLPNVAMTIQLEGPAIPARGTAGPQFVHAAKAGPFTFANVTPGRYRIAVRSTGSAAPSGTTVVGAGGGGAGGPGIGPSADEWATADVDINGEDVNGVVLALRPTLHFAGNITFDARTLPPLDLARVELSLTPVLAAPASTPFGAALPPSRSRPDGTFDFSGVFPGTYRLTMSAPVESGWWLRSVKAGGKDLKDLKELNDLKDLLDTDVVIGAADIRDAVVTLSDRHTSLSGTLRGPAGAAATDFFIVVFAAEREMWHPQSRRVRSARPGTDGTFVLRDFPPGSYFVAVMADLDSSDLGDPAFLEALVPAAVTCVIGEGEQRVQDLKIGG